MLQDIVAGIQRGVFMRRIDELKKEIIHEILNSEEYKEYRRLQAEMDRTPDLKRQVDEFRMRNFELQNSQDVPDMFAAMEILIMNMLICVIRIL